MQDSIFWVGAGCPPDVPNPTIRAEPRLAGVFRATGTRRVSVRDTSPLFFPSYPTRDQQISVREKSKAGLWVDQELLAGVLVIMVFMRFRLFTVSGPFCGPPLGASITAPPQEHACLTT